MGQRIMKRLADYSQYFLRRPQLIKELVGHSSIKKTDVVYDIGAGSGVISAVLATRAKQVVAIEAEPRMAQKLRQNLARYDNVSVVESDVLRYDFPQAPYKVFANIPFHISADIVRRLFLGNAVPKAAYLVVQKQFAQKLLIDRAGFVGQLGAVLAPWCAFRIRRPLRRTDFWPHPNVDTVLLEIMPREEALIDRKKLKAYEAMVVAAYHDPRQFRKLPLGAAGIDPSTKPSQLSLAQWLLLFAAHSGDLHR
ncbi:hypothetical protein CL689_07385 [Candidatus Saccharibacteria bacterium]|nr:hypothetical protein [Candidatus Saccharibacteria bacterium]MBJ58238.1 hypothetical protein [Candidatus Saccharibacteria bacterium]MBQ69840.1 hypothetical protein [Candidatus Saccharibacteria bacterium]|tara:strand:+ start:3947 stop:4702 length:756 start_codon:yes stop_codon:yes gene_type:complete